MRVLEFGSRKVSRRGSPEVTRRPAFTLIFIVATACALPARVSTAAEITTPAPTPDVSASSAPELVGGLVRNGFGAAIEHALILLTPLGSEGNVRTALTDSGGHYRFDGVTAGTYPVTEIPRGEDASIRQVRALISLQRAL